MSAIGQRKALARAKKAIGYLFAFALLLFIFIFMSALLIEVFNVYARALGYGEFQVAEAFVAGVDMVLGLLAMPIACGILLFVCIDFCKHWKQKNWAALAGLIVPFAFAVLIISVYTFDIKTSDYIFILLLIAAYFIFMEKIHERQQSRKGRGDE